MTSLFEQNDKHTIVNNNQNKGFWQPWPKVNCPLMRWLDAWRRTCSSIHCLSGQHWLGLGLFLKKLRTVVEHGDNVSLCLALCFKHIMYVSLPVSFIFKVVYGCHSVGCWPHCKHPGHTCIRLCQGILDFTLLRTVMKSWKNLKLLSINIITWN